MLDINFVLLYVESPAASAAFYQKLLGRPPVEQSATFAMFAMDSGVMLGLWSRHTVEPAATEGGGGGEIAVTVRETAAVDRAHAEWKALGLRILQAPIDLDFGRTFVALDPDGHRLRVFFPTGARARRLPTPRPAASPGRPRRSWGHRGRFRRCA